jgi:hypothetical protein
VIDVVTHDKFVQAERRAKELGLSLMEVLDARRLLLTHDREQTIVTDTLSDLIRRFERQRPNKLMSFYHGRPAGTSAEMFSAVEQWFDAVRQNYLKGTLEDL